MGIRSRLVTFLCDINEFRTISERQALMSWLGLRYIEQFRYIEHKINWEGSAFTFVNNLLIILSQEGREVLLSFLTRLEEASDMFFGMNRREELTLLIADIKSLTPDQYEIEFGTPKSEPNVAKRNIELFYSYAHKDERLRKKLETQLGILKQQGYITNWYDQDISAGAEWAQEINKHLNTAQIILLLVSPDFMASNYCYGIEMKRAIERHERGEARVIPVILRPVYWQFEPLNKLQALPNNAKPITGSSWHNQDEAFFNVAEGIRKEVMEIVGK